MVFLRFNISALLTFAIDYLVFGAFFALSSSVGLSIVFARLCAGAFNYTVNREIVFRSTRRHSVTLLLYALTVLLMGSIAYVSIKALAASGTNVYAAKIFIECVLFLFSFIIQRELIFTKQKDARGRCALRTGARTMTREAHAPTSPRNLPSQASRRTWPDSLPA